MQDARLGKFQVVLVWALDRLSRQGPLAILSLVHRLGRYKVKVLSYQEPWTEAPGELAEILYAIAGWVARMESKRLSERTKAGLARAVAQGHTPGRPHGSKDKKKRKNGRPKFLPGQIWNCIRRLRAEKGAFFAEARLCASALD